MHDTSFAHIVIAPDILADLKRIEEADYPLEDFGGGCPQEALYRETIKLFGLSSLTAKARKFLDVAFSELQKRE